MTVDGPDERLDIAPDAELDAYRLMQEALHNCVKHAGAAHVHVRIGPRRRQPADAAGRGHRRRCRVRPGPAAPGLGLVSMRERAERLGGQLVVAPRRGAGTVVRLVAPRVLGAAG